MKRTAMELAALASAAMPGLDIVQAADSPDDPRAFDSAIVTDTDNNHWRVRSPRDSQAAFRLETEIQVLSGFTPSIRAHLPFRVPSVAGAVQIDTLRTFIYHQMPGRPVELGALTRSQERTIDDIGRIIAAIHQLPSAVVETADLPAYGAEQSRARLLSELDQMALTGKVPASLLRRWENAFEERQMWTFTPRVVHGDFDETSLLIDRDRAVGVTAWTDLHIGDPAQDFLWLASTESLEFREAVISAYHRHMNVAADHLDLHILRRAALAAEFSLAKYLMTGIHADDDAVIDEAQAMLRELAADIEATGGQDIGQRFWEPALRSTDEAVITTDGQDTDEVTDDEDPTQDVPGRDAEETAGEAVAPDETERPVDPAKVESAPAEDLGPEAGPEETAPEHHTELVVHSLTDTGELVPHDPGTAPAEEPEDDTQPISWRKVREELERG